MTSEYGVMELPVEMIGRRKQNDEWMAEYKVLSGSETVLHQKVIWQLVPLS